MVECLIVKDVFLVLDRKNVLRGASLKACPGELTAIVGPNGAGKTSLLLTVTGVYKESRGEVRTPDKPYYLPSENPLFPGLTVYDYYSTVLGGGYLGELDESTEKRVSFYASKLDVAGLEDRAMDTLSSGERQRVMLTAALASKSRVLLLDEPVAHLDLRYQHRAMRILVRESSERIVVTVLHDLNLALRYASKIYLVFDGSISDPWTREKVPVNLLSRAYGIELNVAHLSDGSVFVYPTV